MSWRCNPVHCCNTLGLMRRSSGRALQAIPVVATRCSALQNRKRLSPAARCATDNVAASYASSQLSAGEPLRCSGAAQRIACSSALGGTALGGTFAIASAQPSWRFLSCTANRTMLQHAVLGCNTLHWVATRCTECCSIQRAACTVYDARCNRQRTRYSMQDTTHSRYRTRCCSLTWSVKCAHSGLKKITSGTAAFAKPASIPIV